MNQSESGELPLTLADLAESERKEALKEGLEQGLKNVALTMLQEDLEVDFIAKLTKLSVAEIEKLKEAHT